LSAIYITDDAESCRLCDAYFAGGWSADHQAAPIKRLKDRDGNVELQVGTKSVGFLKSTTEGRAHQSRRIRNFSLEIGAPMRW